MSIICLIIYLLSMIVEYFLILYAFAILLDVQFSDLDMKDFISLWFA
jgi:hypothetical protein